MMRKIGVILLMLLMLAVPSWGSSSQSSNNTLPKGMIVNEAVETRFGNVAVIGREELGACGADTILIHGQEISEDYWAGLWFYNRGNRPNPDDLKKERVFSFADRDVLFFGVQRNCGGSNPGPDRLYFLILRPDGSADVVGGKDFYSADNAILKPRLVGDNIVIDLGYEQGKKKTATLQGDEVRIEYQTVGRIPMREEDCKFLYENIILRDCLNPYKIGCENIGDDSSWSIAVQSTYRLLSQHPGFDAAAFSDMCAKTCQAKQAVPYDEFKERACSL